jgi:hypothetical protein
VIKEAIQRRRQEEQVLEDQIETRRYHQIAETLSRRKPDPPLRNPFTSSTANNIDRSSGARQSSAFLKYPSPLPMEDLGLPDDWLDGDDDEEIDYSRFIFVSEGSHPLTRFTNH